MAGAILFISVAAISEALFGLCLGNIFDAINTTSLNALFYMIGVMIVLIMVNISTSIAARIFMFRNASKKACNLKNTVYRKQMHWNRSNAPDMADFTSKLDLLYNNYFLSYQYILLYGATFICACVAIIYINWIIFAVAFISSAIPFVVPMLFKNKVQKAANEYAETSTKYNSFVTNTLNGRLELIKYNVASKYMDKHAAENVLFETKREKNLLMDYTAQKTTEGIGNLMYVFVLMAGGILVLKNQITIGEVLSTVQLMNGTVVPITMIVSYVNKIVACKPVYEGMKNDELEPMSEACMDDKSFDEITCESIDSLTQEVFVVEGITYGYPDVDKKLIQQFSYTFMPGKKYLIKGPSGSGKTTLAKILSGELAPDSGTVKYGQLDIFELPVIRRNKIVNYLEQEPYLFNDSVLNNITLYRENGSREKIEQELQQVGVKNVGLDTMIEDKSRVSGGEKLRICLLRSALEMPKVLICDEPTAALDKENSEKVIKFLCKSEGTIIVIAHNLIDTLEDMFDDVINI